MKKSNLIKKVKKAALCISVFLLVSASAVVVASATPAATAGVDAWTNVMNFLIPWIWRLGGAVMLVGGIMFGLAFKGDDADGKTRALQTLIAGAIVTAVGVSSNVFLI